MQPEHTVKLVALWVRGLAHYDMEAGSQAQQVWNPLHEANPYPDPMRLPPMRLQQLRSRDCIVRAIPGDLRSATVDTCSVMFTLQR